MCVLFMSSINSHSRKLHNVQTIFTIFGESNSLTDWQETNLGAIQQTSGSGLMQKSGLESRITYAWDFSYLGGGLRLLNTDRYTCSTCSRDWCSFFSWRCNLRRHGSCSGRRQHQAHSINNRFIHLHSVNYQQQRN